MNRLCARLLVPLSIALPALAAAAEQKRPAIPEPLGTGSLLQMIVALAAVLAAIGLLTWAMRRFGSLQSGAGGGVRLIGGISVGNRERVVLVQVGEQQLLIGVAPGRVNTLHVLEKPITLEGQANGSFAERLATAMKRQGKSP